MIPKMLIVSAIISTSCQEQLTAARAAMADLVTDKADCSGSFPGGPGGGKDDHASHALDFGVHFQTNSRIHACNQQWQWEIQHVFALGRPFFSRQTIYHRGIYQQTRKANSF